jgi:orotidine-5'-phosphate decarboxylase
MGFGARVAAAVARAGTPLVLGIDPRREDLPPGTAPSEFLSRLLDLAVEERLPAVKVQVAFFEEQGARGMRAFEEALSGARRRGLIAIADVKRGDVGSTAEAYAKAYFGGAGFEADAITASPFLGRESLEPLVRAATRAGGGVFVLVRTSNPGAGALQEPIFERLADLVADLNEPTVDESGWGAVGAVAGATVPDAAVRLRALLPRSILLLPGVGAQGGRIEDLRPLFDARGLGALVPVSRAISGAWRAPGAPAHWTEACRAAIRRIRDELAK